MCIAYPRFTCIIIQKNYCSYNAKTPQIFSSSLFPLQGLFWRFKELRQLLFSALFYYFMFSVDWFSNEGFTYGKLSMIYLIVILHCDTLDCTALEFKIYAILICVPCNSTTHIAKMICKPLFWSSEVKRFVVFGRVLKPCAVQWSWLQFLDWVAKNSAQWKLPEWQSL